MVTFKTMDSSILSLIILMFLYVSAYNRSEKIYTEYKLFISLIETNMIIIVIDIFGWVFNGLPGAQNMFLNTASNMVLYILVPLGPILWTLYSAFQVSHNEIVVKKLQNILKILFTIHAVVAVLSLYTGWFFTVDSQNFYHREDYFWIHIAFCYSFLIYSLYIIIKNRAKVETKYYYSMLLYVLPISIGGLLQTLFYGVSLTWSGMMLSILIIYFNIQDKALNTDYLSGLYNRRRLESYLHVKIQNSSENRSFSGIIIDLNRFKEINDEYGHDVGDKAIKDTAMILKKSLEPNDFIARYGGDEFFIILDIDNREILDQVVEKIYENVDCYNTFRQAPYEISFSIGYDIYDHKTALGTDEFLRHIDLLMYKNKRSRV